MVASNVFYYAFCLPVSFLVCVFQLCAYGLTWSADLNDCVKCSCNGHSDHCDPLNGTCFVSTVVVTKRERNHVTTDNDFKSIFSTGGYSYLEPRTPLVLFCPVRRALRTIATNLDIYSKGKRLNGTRPQLRISCKLLLSCFCCCY